MPPYKERFPLGSQVSVAPREQLETFLREWRFHHPLTPNQLEYAGTETIICDVGYYHGGDVLYSLEEVPGLWHEQCLRDTGSHRAP